MHANRTYSVTKGDQHVLAHGPLPELRHGLDGASPSSLVGVKLDMEISVVGDATISGRLNGSPVVTVVDDAGGAAGCPRRRAPLDCVYTSGFASLASGWHRAVFTSVAVQPATA